MVRRSILLPAGRARDRLPWVRRVLAWGCAMVLVGSTAGAGGSGTATAVPPAPAPLGADPVTIPTRSLPEERERVPAAVATVGAEEARRARPQLGLHEALDRVPGLVVQSRTNFAQDLRLSSRGFGARSSFGIRGLKVYVDGIPATLPDGQTSLDAIDPGALERIEVLRGPAAALYGPSAGGVLRIRNAEPPETPFVDARAAFGRYGFARARLAGGARSGPLGAWASVSRLVWDGHRDHASAHSSMLNGRLRFAPGPDWEANLIVHAVQAPRAEDPGALTREELRADPSQASARNVRFDAGERVREQALGLSARRRLDPQHEVSVRGYSLWRDFSNRLPFESGGAVELDRFFGGGGAELSGEGGWPSAEHHWTLGFDVDAQRDHRLRFDNQEGHRGPLRFDQDEDVTAAGVYVGSRWTLRGNLHVAASARLDSVRFRVRDGFRSDGNDSGDRRFRELSPSLGLSWQAARGLGLYANVSTSFETPTTTEFANPSGGGLNPDLDAAHALGFEMGIKGWFPGRVRYDVAVFRIRVKDELVPFEIPSEPGRTFFRNAGRSTREGLEIGVAVEPRPGWQATAAYTFSDFRFDRYQTPEGEFDGNRLPGIPRHQAFVELAYRSASGFLVAWETRYVSAIPADDANATSARSTRVSSLRVARRIRVGRLEVEPFAGVDNVFDRDGVENVRINAFGGRFFEPAPGRSAYGGLRVRHDWGP